VVPLGHLFFYVCAKSQQVVFAATIEM